MVLHKRLIDIVPHAYHRALERFRLAKADATAAIRQALRKGTWYENPSQPDEFLVIHRYRNQVLHVIAKLEPRRVTVTTLYPMRNTAKVRAYMQHSPALDARAIAQRYQLVN